MKNLKTRYADVSERSAIQTMARDVIRGRYTAFFGPEMVDAFIGSGQADEEFVTHEDNLYVLVDGSDIIGFSICFENFIHLLMVKMERQNEGLGSVLLKDCEAMIRDRGHQSARLETFVSNVQAVAFYLKNGWTETARDGEDAGTLARIWFEKKLT